MGKLMPTITEHKQMTVYADKAMQTGFFQFKNNAQAFMVALKGFELGVPPMYAMTHIHVIKGRPTVSAELMLAMVYQKIPGVVVNFKELTNNKCRIEAKRPGGEFCAFEFTLEDAKRAGLVKPDSGWTKYPRAMCRSRAVSEMCRSLFPDAVLGCSITAEEMGAQVTEEGEVIRGATSLITELIKREEPSPVGNVEEASYEIDEEIPPPVFNYADEVNLAPSLEPEAPSLAEVVGNNSSFGEYIVQGGKFKGQQLKAIPIIDLDQYYSWADSLTDPKPFMKEFCTFAKGYMDSVGTQA